MLIIGSLIVHLLSSEQLHSQQSKDEDEQEEQEQQGNDTPHRVHERAHQVPQ